MSRPILKALALALAAILLAGCPPKTLPVTPPAPPTETPPPTVPTGEADLALGEVRIEVNDDAYMDYLVVATIHNNGAGTANGLNAGCTYKCPPGETTISAGLDIVIGGEIEGKSRITYWSSFHYPCTGRPPRLDLVCTIESDQGTRSFPVSVTLP